MYIASATSVACDKVRNWVGEDWFLMARPFFPLVFGAGMNTFQGTHLSFKVHLMDDHALGEEETNSYFKTQNEKRRLETVEAVKKRRRDVEKYKKNKREILEAYVDKKGELRVRTVQRYVEHDRDNKTVCDMMEEDTMKEYLYDTEENVDVSAKEYIDVVTVVQCNKQGSPDENQDKEKLSNNVNPRNSNTSMDKVTKRNESHLKCQITRNTKSSLTSLLSLPLQFVHYVYHHYVFLLIFLIDLKV